MVKQKLEQQKQLGNLVAKNKLYGEVILDLVRESEDYGNVYKLDNLKTKCEEVVKYGSKGGAIIRLVYEQDAVEFFDKFEKEILKLLGLFDNNKLKAKLSRLAYEHIANEVALVLS